MKKRLLFLPIISLLLMSCAVNLQKVTEQYRAAPLCCSGYSEFEYEEIKLGDRRKIFIDSHSKAYEFKWGKSFFRAFKLPEYKRPYGIIIKSFFLGGQPRKAYIFSPMVILLDKDFNITYKIRGNSFTNIKTLIGFRKGLVAEIPVTEEDSEGRYMVILTTEELLRGRTGLEVPVMMPLFIPGLAGALPIGANYIKVPHSPVGKVTVELKALGNGR